MSQFITRRDFSAQTGSEESFAGGKPRLPPGTSVPTCDLCGSMQTFFFQIAFPDSHAWARHTLAVFACTCCADENHLIPEMLAGVLRGADVPKEFLSRYQRNFRCEVFPTESGQMVSTYLESVRFRVLSLDGENGLPFGRMGGTAAWILDDETPAACDGLSLLQFLLQLEPELVFECLPEAPAQIELGLSGKPEPSPNRFYRLFISNAVYFFGTVPTEGCGVYVLTQV